MAASHSRSRRAITIGAWLFLAAACGLTIAARLSITVDLAYFLPPAATEQERVLIDRLGQGPGSQLIFATVTGRDRADVMARSARLAAALTGSPLFTQVLSGQEELTRESIPDVVWAHRYLLADIDADAAGLRRALQDRLADLAVFSGDEFADVLAADPMLAAMTVMERLAWSTESTLPDWTGADGRSAFLITQVAAPAFDIGAQAEAMAAIHAAAAAVDAAPATLNGVGVYGVELQHTIRSEAQFRSLLASLAIIIVLLVAYRRWRITVLAVVPLALGALAGIACIALIFGQVHGITLAFGFTLFGVAVDYPLHVFSHARGRHPQEAIRAVWPTLRLGAASTIIAYLSVSLAGSRGLAQLGILSSVGLLVAVLATRSLLPLLMTPATAGAPRETGRSSTALRPALRHGVWIIVCLIGGAVIAAQGSIWSNDLSTMTPIAPEKLRRDTQLRMALGAPDIRHLIALRAPTEQAALEATETLAAELDAARNDGLIDGYRVVTDLLPSHRTQLRRRAAVRAIDAPADIVRLAVDGTPFRADGFAPFTAALASTAEQEPLNAIDFQSSALAGYVDAHLAFDGERWTSFATLFGLTDPEALATLLRERYPDATLVDLKLASQALVLRYRQRIQVVLLASLALIIVFLIVRVGWSARLGWIVGSLTASMLGTIALNATLAAPLTIFNLIALVLVAGLGLDYGLFMSRTEDDAEQAAQTRHAVLVCVGSTLLAFLILAFSSVPILASLGTTVTIGVALNYAVATLGARRRGQTGTRR